MEEQEAPDIVKSAPNVVVWTTESIPTAAQTAAQSMEELAALLKDDLGQLDEGDDLQGPVPVTAQGMKPWEAAQEVRLHSNTLLKRLGNLQEKLRKEGNHAAALSMRRADTDGSARYLLGTLGSRTRVGDRRRAWEVLLENIQAEREILPSEHQLIAYARQSVRDAVALCTRIHKSAQNLATQPDIPVGKDANTVRGIKAVLKGHGTYDAKMKAITMIIAISDEGGDDEQEEKG